MTKTLLTNDCVQKLLDSDLSSETKSSYEQCLRQLVSWFNGEDILQIIAKPERLYRKLLQMYSNRGSIRKYLVACLSLFRHDSQLKIQMPKAYEELSKLLKSVADEVNIAYKYNKPSEKQTEQFVDYSVALAKYEKLERGTPEAILLGLYVLMPPKRNDYWDAKVYMHTSPIADTGNYFIIDQRENAEACKQSWLIMNDYKTAGSYGQLREMIPDRLAYEIKLSIKRHPRQYLFVNRSNHPYNSPNTFCKFATERLSTIFGKHVTLTMFRHSYCTKIRNSDLTLDVKQKLARSMGHSTTMQDSYSYKQVYCEPRRLNKTCARVTDNDQGLAIPTESVTETTPAPPPIDTQWIPQQYKDTADTPATYVVRKIKSVEFTKSYRNAQISQGHNVEHM